MRVIQKKNATVIKSGRRNTKCLRQLALYIQRQLFLCLLGTLTRNLFQNICSFITADGTVDCIQSDCIKGVQLCSDVPQMLPTTTAPEFVEFWANKAAE